MGDLRATADINNFVESFVLTNDVEATETTDYYSSVGGTKICMFTNTIAWLSVRMVMTTYDSTGDDSECVLCRAKGATSIRTSLDMTEPCLFIIILYDCRAVEKSVCDSETVTLLPVIETPIVKLDALVPGDDVSSCTDSKEHESGGKWTWTLASEIIVL